MGWAKRGMESTIELEMTAMLTPSHRAVLLVPGLCEGLSD